MPKPIPSKSGKSSSKKMDSAIVIAIIGLIGTFLTALLASPVLIAWIQTSNSPTNIPAATLPLPASATAIDVTSTVPASPTVTPTFTPTLVAQDWKSIIKLRIDLAPSCSASWQIMPPTINPAENISDAVQQVDQALANGESYKWLSVDARAIGIEVSSIVADQEWIKVSNKLLIDVIAQNNSLENINVLDYSECGGDGSIRSFPTINLSNDFLTYSLNSVFSGVPFFTLQPGETEYFELPLKCGAVGIYQLKLNVSFEYSGSSNVTNSDQAFGVVCPETFTVWYYNRSGHQFLSSHSYRWNGNGYEQVP